MKLNRIQSCSCLQMQTSLDPTGSLVWINSFVVTTWNADDKNYVFDIAEFGHSKKKNWFCIEYRANSNKKDWCNTELRIEWGFKEKQSLVSYLVFEDEKIDTQPVRRTQIRRKTLSNDSIQVIRTLQKPILISVS